MISKKDTLLLKGIGILLIIIHNFLHKVKPVYFENEFSFNPIIFGNYWSAFLDNPYNIFQYLFSYFGHYGVQIFIFCSGYGLAMNYIDKELKFFTFIKKRLLKLYPVFIMAVGMVVFLRYAILRAPFSFEYIYDVVFRLTLVANFIPGKQLSISGPFWFYSLIIQLYICFYFLIKYFKNNTKILWGILGLSYGTIFLFQPYMLEKNLSLYFNFVGNLPVFVLGIILAINAFDFRKLPWAIWFLALGFFILGQWQVYFWYFSQLIFVLISTPIILKIKDYFSISLIYRFLLYTGGLSMYIFAVNGVLRSPWFYLLRQNESSWFPYILLFAHLVLVYLVSIVFRKVEAYLITMFKLNSN